LTTFILCKTDVFHWPVLVEADRKVESRILLSAHRRKEFLKVFFGCEFTQPSDINFSFVCICICPLLPALRIRDINVEGALRFKFTTMQLQCPFS